MKKYPTTIPSGINSVLNEIGLRHETVRKHRHFLFSFFSVEWCWLYMGNAYPCGIREEKVRSTNGRKYFSEWEKRRQRNILYSHNNTRSLSKKIL